MDCSKEDVEAARQLALELSSFDNHHLSLIANTKRVTDKSRGLIIAELIAREFGDQILTKNVFNPFGSSVGLVSTTDYRK